MSQTQTINTPQDYVNYTFNIEARGIAEVSSEMMGLSNTVGNILGQLAFKTSEFLSHTDMLAMGTGVAVSAMFTSAAKDAIHFQQQIANVQAIGGEAINAQDIGNAAMEFSNKFGMATSSMTEGLEALARAGITSTGVMKEVLAEGVKLSKLEGLDLEDSINDLISTTNLLSEAGVDMNDANYGQLVQEMNQHIVSTSESAPINAQNIIQTLQHVGGYASASGMDQEDLFAVIAQLGSRGTKGEMAGTALRAFIAAGQKDTAQRALARIGLNVNDLWNDNGETMLSISEMKDVLDNALEARGYSKQEKLEFYSDFAGYKQANQIMKIDTSEVQQYKESIANAWDLGKKLDVILGTVRGNLDRIWQTTQNFMTRVGSNILDVMSALLTPVRIFLDIFTKIPFADKAVAAGMIFVAFRTGLMIFNKLVPAVGGFMSGLGKAKDETRGFRGEWTKTREEIEKTKDIIFLLRKGDQEGLAKKHYEEHGLSARNKMAAERDIAGQMYMASDWYKEHGRIPWENLHVAAQDMILERFKGTKEFKTNYQAFVDLTKQNVDEIVSKPIIIEDFEEKDTLEAINVWVQEIFELLNSDRTQGRWGDGNNESGPQSNQERNAQAHILSNIFNNRVRGNSYGNVDFKYEKTEEGYQEAKAGLKQAYSDLRTYTRALSNTDVNNINSIQRNAYKKLFTQVSERGIEATKTANESEIRLVLEKGVLETHENPWEGIKDSQVQYIAEKLGLDDFKFYDSTQGDRRAEFAQQARAAIEAQDEGVRQGIIDELVRGSDGNGGTNKLWEDSLQDIARGRRQFLLNNSGIANQIVSQLHIDTNGFNSTTDAVLSHFSELDDTSTDWDVAVKAAMSVLKNDSGYSKIEENTIKYIADNIARHKETILNFQNNAESFGLSEAIQDELMDIVADMQNDADLLRAGGEELGAAIVNGFVGDGLGRHSPGHMFWALVDEQTDISNAILQSRGLFNQNAGLLGLEITNAFDKNLGINRVFDSGIEFLRRDSDVIKDIIADFDRDEFRTDDEQDLEYDLLPSQQDVQDYLSPANKTALEHFVRPYGFDMSNYERFGTNFGRDWNDIVRFQSMMWFLKNDFDFEKMFDSNKFDEDAIYDYMGLVDKHFAIDSTWLQLKTYPGEIDDELYANMNTWLEDFYFIFLDTLSLNMRQIISNSEGLVDNVKLYRGGRLPLTGENLGEYLGTTSTSYTSRIADYYTWSNGAVNYRTNVFAPEGTLGIHPNADLLGDKTFIDGVKSRNVYNNQLEYTLGNGQPFIELPNEVTGEMSGAAVRSEADILLLNPAQIAAVTSVVVDEVSSMINSGRSDSNILNMNGIDAVNNLVSLKTKEDVEKASGSALKRTKAPQKGPGYTSPMDAPIEDKFNDMVENVLNYFRETSAMGVTWLPAGPFDYNPDSTTFDNTEQISTFIHEMTHLLRNQYERGNLSPADSNYIPFTLTSESVGNYHMGHFKEWEAEYVEYHTLKKLGMEPSKIAKQRMDEHAQYLENEGYGQYMHRDDLDAMVDFFVQNIEDVVGYIDNFIYDISKYSKDNYQIEYGDSIATWQRTKDLIKNPQSKYTKVLPSINDIINSNLANKEGYLEIGANDDNIVKFQDYFTARRRDYQAAHPRAKGDAKTVLKEFKTKEKDLLQQYGIFITRGERLLNIKNKEAAETAYLGDDVSFKKMLNIQKQYDAGYDETDLLKWGYYKGDKAAISHYNKISKQKQAQVASGALSQQQYNEWQQSIQNYTPSDIVDWHNYFKHDGYIGANITDTGKADTEFFDYINNYLPQLVLKKNKEKEVITRSDIATVIEEETDFIGRELSALVENVEQIYKLTLSFHGQEFVNPAYEPKPFGMPGLVENSGYIDIKNAQRKAEEQKLKNIQDIEAGKYQHLMGVGVQTPSEEYTKKKKTKRQENSEYEDRINNEMKSKYGSLFPDMDNKFNKARYIVNKDGQGNQHIMAGLDLGEEISNKINDKVMSVLKSVASKKDDEAADAYIEGIDSIKSTIEGVLGPMRSFNDGLERASEVFPPLATASWALNGAITALEAVTWMLDVAKMFLSGTEIVDQLATWGLVSAKTAETVAEASAAVATWGLNAALFVLDMLLGPIGLILAAIAATLVVVKFWEGEHAKALEKSRKELEENTARNNIAVSQYKDLKKARESETDAIKKQKAARQEAIALYELEASRIKKQKSIREEAKLRNDAIWGEYGLRADLQKAGLGIIAGGDFESQYQNYEGTTSNIRQIKESQVGKIFKGTAEQEYVSKVYDENSMFFAQVEGNKEPLQELYDKESSLIERYGSVEAARGSKEFADAVKEFSDATGINGKTAGMMLDWLETENRVSQATKIGQAEIGMIQAQTQAKVMAIDAEGEYGLGDMNNLGDAMIVAQFQEMMNTAKTEMWWDLLFAYMNLILSALSPWDWFTGETAKNQKKVAAYQEGLNELDAQGNKILQDMLDNEAERNDYGTGSLSNYHDSPFGGALASAGMSQAPTTGNNNVMQTMSQTTDTSQVYDNFQESVKEAPKIEQANVPTTPTQQTNQQSTGKTSTTVVHIHNININTEDDPEKIKSALMNLIIEMQEQVVPRTVSRTIGQSPTQSSSMTQNPNDSTQAEGTDTQSGTTTDNTNNNGNQNPTV